MDKPAAQRAPSGLGTAGKKLWSELHLALTFEPHEVPVVREACKLEDEIAKLRAELAADGRPLVKGSMGQQVANPLYSEIRQHLALQHKLLASISVDQSGLKMTRSESGRVAARSRWAQHFG